MPAKKTPLLTLAAALLIQVGVQANDILTEFEFQLVNPAISEISIDGDLSEWTGFELIENPVFIGDGQGGAVGEERTFSEWNGGEWEGFEDFSHSFQLLYDEDNLYIAFIVTDDYHEHAATGPGGAWNGDSAQLYIANDERDTQVALYNMALEGSEGDANFFPICSPDVGACTIHFESGPGVEGDIDVAILRDSASTTTTYEMRLSKESLGLDAGLVPNVSYGLGWAINDGDLGTPGQKGWSGLGPHSVVHGKSAEETAAFFLGEEVIPDDWPGDVNGDGHTDVADLNIIGTNWQTMGGATLETGDLTGDGNVDVADLNILGVNWQTWDPNAPMPSAVPEPSSFLLAAGGLFLLFMKRRR